MSKVKTRKYEVMVQRIDCREQAFTVEAQDETDACNTALGVAGDHDFGNNKGSVEYEVVCSEEVE